MRVPSPKLCFNSLGQASGGWLHFYDESELKHLAPKALPQREKPKIDCFALMRKWELKTTIFQKLVFARVIGVRLSALVALGAAWAPEYKAWAFPMQNADGNVIGIRLRNMRAFKWAVNGSLQGIFVPKIKPNESEKIALLPEGPTDVCAALSLGLYAIGRPTCQTGNEMLGPCLRRLGISRAIIVQDNDDKKYRSKQDEKGFYPGIDGALKCKKELGMPSVIWTPPSPIKDLREFKNKGGTVEMIMSEVKHKVWGRK